MRNILIILLVVSVAATAMAAPPTTDEVIARAREYLGGDAALNAVRSIYYEGEYEARDGARGTLRIYFQKPMQQRIELARDELGEITALDDFDAWRKVYDLNDESRWQLRVLEPARVRELQANTWENLNFFRNIEQRHGRIDDEGTVDLDGKRSRKLIFRYPKGIAFTRYFDEESGRLLMTETHEGIRIHEYGRQVIGGIVFPERIVMTRNGELVNEIRFSRITINEKFDDALFSIPSITP